MTLKVFMSIQNLMDWGIDKQLARLQLLYQLWQKDKNNEKIRSEYEQALGEVKDLVNRELPQKWHWENERLQKELDNYYESKDDKKSNYYADPLDDENLDDDDIPF